MSHAAAAPAVGTCSPSRQPLSITLAHGTRRGSQGPRTTGETAAVPRFHPFGGNLRAKWNPSNDKNPATAAAIRPGQAASKAKRYEDEAKNVPEGKDEEHDRYNKQIRTLAHTRSASFQP